MNIANVNANSQDQSAANCQKGAKKREIAATYAADKRDKRQSRRKPPLAWIRASELERLLLERCGRTLPDDDAGEEYLWTVLQHLASGPDAVRRCQRFIRTWAPWLSEDKAGEKISAAIDNPYRFKAATLGRLMRLAGIHWTVAWRPFGGDVESCGFASTPDGAKTIANDHRRRLG
jgi:hypothetical protein